MAQEVKVLAAQAKRPEFDPLYQFISGKREPSPKNCPLTFTCMLRWDVCMCACVFVHTHTN